MKPGVDGDTGSTKDPVFEMSSNSVGTAFAADNLNDYSQDVKLLIEARSPVLIYAGEFDAQDGPKTQEYWLRRLNFTGSDEFWSQSRQVYWVNNFTDSSQPQLNGGLWRTSDYFEFLTLPKAGHFVPNNFFSASHQLLTDYIAGQKLACHKTDDTQCSVVQARCDAMSNCNGHGKCDDVTAQCVCDTGYKFADCSKKVEIMDDNFDKDWALPIEGPGWFTM